MICFVDVDSGDQSATFKDDLPAYKAAQALMTNQQLGNNCTLKRDCGSEGHV